MEKSLRIPVYRYYSDEQISGTEDFRYVCLQPGTPLNKEQDDTAKTTTETATMMENVVEQEQVCNRGFNTLNTFLNHLHDEHQAPRFRNHMDYCCGQMFYSRLQAVIHFMNHALRFTHINPYINTGTGDEVAQQTCTRLETERKIIIEKAKKDMNIPSSAVKRKLPDFNVESGNTAEKIIRTQ